MFRCIILISAYFLVGISAHVKIVNVTDCPKFTTGIQGVSLTTHFKNSAFDANFTVPFTLDEEVYVNAVIHSKDGKKWKESGVEMNGDFCFVMTDMFSDVWKKAIKLMKIAHPCPIPKGTYTLKGLTVSYKEMPIKIEEDNTEYLITIKFSKNDKNFACKNIQALVTPD